MICLDKSFKPTFNMACQEHIMGSDFYPCHAANSFYFECIRMYSYSVTFGAATRNHVVNMTERVHKVARRDFNVSKRGTKWLKRGKNEN